MTSVTIIQSLTRNQICMNRLLLSTSSMGGWQRHGAILWTRQLPVPIQLMSPIQALNPRYLSTSSSNPDMKPRTVMVARKAQTYIPGRVLAHAVHPRYLSKYNPKVKPPSKVRFGIIKQYMALVEKMERGLEKRSPKAYKIYMLFKIGVKDFFSDFKMYYTVATDLWKDKPLNAFTRKELENYRQYLWEFLKVGPLVVLLNIPILDTLLPILLYLFPRHLLCRHFWTPEQRIEFAQYYLRQRYTQFSSVAKYLRKHTKDIKEEDQKTQFQALMKKIESGQEAAVSEILALKPIFISKPFGLDYISKIHKIHSYHLAKGMNLSTRRSKLPEQMNLVHHIDMAMLREGLESMTTEELQQACFVRGLDASKLEREGLEAYLSKWLKISEEVNSESLSLLVHTPVFLALHHPANTSLGQKKAATSS